MSIKVDDEKLKGAGTKIQTFGKNADDIFSRYIACMTKLGTEGFTEGETSDNIKAFIESIGTLKDQLTELTKNVASECDKYIKDLDKADDFVY